MLVPIVSNATREQVWKEVNEVEARGECFSVEMMKRLSGDQGSENPVVADFTFRIFTTYKGEPWLAKALAYAFLVYRMIEIEAGGKLPLISEEIGAPMQEEFFRDLHGYLKKRARKIQRENFQVIAACTDLVWLEAMSENSEDGRAAKLVLSIGVVVYMFIHNQLEVNALNKL